MTISCWCPTCQTVREMRLSASLGLCACPACDGAFTIAELQEAAYQDGYDDAQAERVTGTARRRA